MFFILGFFNALRINKDQHQQKWSTQQTSEEARPNFKAAFGANLGSRPVQSWVPSLDMSSLPFCLPSTSMGAKVCKGRKKPIGLGCPSKVGVVFPSRVGAPVWTCPVFFFAPLAPSRVGAPVWTCPVCCESCESPKDSRYAILSRRVCRRGFFCASNC